MWLAHGKHADVKTAVAVVQGTCSYDARDMMMLLLLLTCWIHSALLPASHTISDSHCATACIADKEGILATIRLLQHTCTLVKCEPVRLQPDIV